jgi:hypothetical protein
MPTSRRTESCYPSAVFQATLRQITNVNLLCRCQPCLNALKRGSILGSQSLLGQPFMSDGRLSPTPSYATSIDEVSLTSRA